MTTPYVEYEVLDRQSDGQSTPYYVSITGEVSTTQTTVTPTLAILSEEEEKAEFLNFWEDAASLYWANGVPEESVEAPHYDYYIAVSNYLEHHAERLGETILFFLIPAVFSVIAVYPLTKIFLNDKKGKGKDED